MSEILQSPCICLPGEIPEGSAVGGKAAALARLHNSGFTVPPWIVILPQAFTASACVADVHWQSRRGNWDGFRKWISELKPATAVLSELEKRLADFPADALFAVRSSAVGEDSSGHSFAGQLDSFLFVPSTEVPRRIAQVWASAFSERILAYRRERSLDILPDAPGVIVQQMVNSEIAGVAFSADPVSGKRNVAIISAVWGLGSGLVSGECDADTWHVNRAGEISERNIASKVRAHRYAPGSHEGVTAQPISAERHSQACLSDQQVIVIATLARQAADFFGRPQDIEWAIENDTLYLLQSRPVTSLGNMADPDGAWALWDNSNIAESYNGITTPLTFSFARMAYAAVYEQFCHLMGVPNKRIEANRTTFDRMLGLIRGRVYYNLLSWYRVLALLPGFKVNRRFMEQMMGVKEGLPAAALSEFDKNQPRFNEKLKDSIALARTIVGLVANHFTLERQIVEFNDRLARALQPPSIPLKQMRLDELATHYHQLERDLLLRWDAPLVNDFLAMIFFGVLRDLSRRWIGDEAGTLPNDLLSGEGGIISTEPARRVRIMAGLARRDPALMEILCSGSLEQIEPVMAAHPEFCEAYRDYLERFGERCLEELKLETITLQDNPLPLLRSIGHAARRGLDQVGFDETKLRRTAEAHVKSVLSGRRIRQFIFQWILQHARARVKSRENLRFERTRVFGRVRRVFAEMGQRLAAEDHLVDPRDVFYLTVEELLGFVEGTAVSTNLSGLAELRKAEFAKWRAAPAPADRFETAGAVHIGNRFTGSHVHDEALRTGDELRGIGCCPGVVRGRARVILHPENAEVHPGEILVAPRTDPGWILLFPAASGLLVEYGSLLSHSAIVSREMGIPAVVSLTGLTSWVHTGDWLEMDGAKGIVRKLQNPPPNQT